MLQKQYYDAFKVHYRVFAAKITSLEEHYKWHMPMLSQQSVLLPLLMNVNEWQLLRTEKGKEKLIYNNTEKGKEKLIYNRYSLRPAKIGVSNIGTCTSLV